MRAGDATEARGIEPSDLPEVGGPDSYYIVVTDILPEPASLGQRHYE